MRPSSRKQPPKLAYLKRHKTLKKWLIRLGVAAVSFGVLSSLTRGEYDPRIVDHEFYYGPG